MKENLLDRIRIASPCSADWESMSGTERARFCSQCGLHVYDISQLTRREALNLIASTEGRLCGRVHRRADGTVLTRDCPVGLRALRRRVARIAGASLAALLSLFSVTAAQKRSTDKSSCPQSIFNVEKKKNQGQQGIVRGRVIDPLCAAVTEAHVTLVNELTKEKLETVSNDNGEFILTAVIEGNYSLEVWAAGFAPSKLEKMAVGNEELELTATLTATHVLTGLLAIPIELPIKSRPGTMVLSGDLIRRLPH